MRAVAIMPALVTVLLTLSNASSATEYALSVSRSHSAAYLPISDSLTKTSSINPSGASLRILAPSMTNSEFSSNVFLLLKLRNNLILPFAGEVMGYIFIKAFNVVEGLWR